MFNWVCPCGTENVYSGHGDTECTGCGCRFTGEVTQDGLEAVVRAQLYALHRLDELNEVGEWGRAVEALRTRKGGVHSIMARNVDPGGSWTAARWPADELELVEVEVPE